MPEQAPSTYFIDHEAKPHTPPGRSSPGVNALHVVRGFLYENSLAVADAAVQVRYEEPSQVFCCRVERPGRTGSARIIRKEV